MVKNLPAMQETWVRSLGREDVMGEGNSNSLQYSCLGNPTDTGAWLSTDYGVARVGHELATKQEQWQYLGIFIEVEKLTYTDPYTLRRSNQSILKEISPGISLEGKMLKLKLQYFATS